MSQGYNRSNPLPVLTFECNPIQARPHQCTGRTYWDGKCECHCHRPATSERSKTR